MCHFKRAGNNKIEKIAFKFEAMATQYRFPFCITGLLILLAFSCNKKHESSEIETAMQQYDRLIGDLGSAAHGRDSIKSFLTKFSNVKVLSQVSQTPSIAINKDTAVQTGYYQQADVIDQKDTIKVKGAFTAKWFWINKEGWRIKKWKQNLFNI